MSPAVRPRPRRRGITASLARLLAPGAAALVLVSSIGVVDVATAPPAAAATTTVYVSPTGTDSGTCGATPATACKTIAQAITNASASDAGSPLVVQLAPGTYDETAATLLNATGGANPSSITVKGASSTRADTVIDAGSPVSPGFNVFVDLGTVEFDNLTIQNAFVHGSGSAILQLAGSLTLSNDDISHNNTATAGTNDSGGAVDVVGTAGVTITQSTFDSDTMTTTDGGRGGGALSLDGGTLTISGSAFTRDKTIGGCQGGGGAIIAAGVSLSITGSNFANDSSCHGGAIRLDGGPSSGTIGNTTFSSNMATDPDQGGGAILANNIGAPGLAFTADTFESNENNGGGPGGALILTGAATVTSTVTNSGFTNNSAGNFGGAIFNLTENLVVTNTSFDENPVASTGQGGAIFTNSSIDIEHDRFDSNNAGSGGAIGAIAGPLVVNSSTFSNNAATADGGAIKVAQAATIMTSTFIGNSAGTNGGAIALSGGAASDSFNVSKDNFFGNSATVVGGAIFDNAAAAPVLIDNDGFSSFIGGVPGNSAGLGGAIATQTGSTTTVSNSTFTDNGSLTSSPGVVATLAGGALFSPAGALVLTADTFRANKVTASGGGVYLSSPATVTRSTFTGNMAVNGGAILSDVAQVTVSNNTISANSARLGGGIFVAGGALGSTDDTLTLNTAAEAGGAVYNGNTGTATLNFDTLSNDSTASVAALQNAGAGTLTVSDSILNETLSCSGTITDGGYNAESDNSCGFGATDVVSSPNLHVAAALDANGSSGPQTLAIDSSSSASSLVPLARCTGVNNNTDERGFARPDPAGGPCDAGAFEVAGAPPAATITGTPPAATIGKPYSFTFTTTGSTGCTLAAPLPAGLSFNAATCTISGTPATSGSFPISVVANGNGGNSAPDVATLISHRPISRAAVVAASTNWSLGDALPGTTTNNFSYGTKPLSPLMGDWNGDGIRTVGTFELGTFKLRNSNTAGAPDVIFTFGDPRGFPVAGDFDGNGYTDVAVYRAGHWQIHYLGPGAPADQSFSLGAPFATGTYPNTVPVAGDWNGDGIDGIGTYNLANGTWTLKNTVGAGAPDIAPFVFWGGVGSYPVVGDWTGIGIDTPGYRQGSVWTVRTTAVTEGPTSTFNFGVTNSVPFAWSAP